MTILKNLDCINNTMKSFKELREAAKPKGEVVLDKKIKRIPVKIVKNAKGMFDAFVDGDLLDTFKKQPEAEKAINTVIKELS